MLQSLREHVHHTPCINFVFEPDDEVVVRADPWLGAAMLFVHAAVQHFAGWGFDEEATREHDPVAAASAGRVSMGGVLHPTQANSASPTFSVSTLDDWFLGARSSLG